MRAITEICLHCTATQADFMPGSNTAERVAEVKRWHVSGNGWSDIGYHRLIDRDGTRVDGRPMERNGAGVKGHNTGVIHVSLFGGHGSSENDSFGENYTAAQESALRAEITQLQRMYGPGLKVTGHNQFAAKACPGFQVAAWLNETPTRKSVTESTTVKSAVGGLGLSGSSVIGAFRELDGTLQYVVIIGGVVLAGLFLWIIRERVKRWASGVR